MSPLLLGILIFGGTLAIVIVTLTIVTVAVRRMAVSGAGTVDDHFAGKTILLNIPNANFFGQQSLGVTQVRGNGSLAVTEDELYFVRWVPRKEFVVPLRHIQSVEIAKGFLGKRQLGRLLVKVNFMNDAGEPDAMAWHVADAEGVKSRLEAIIGNAT